MHPLSDSALSLDAYRDGNWLVFDLETTNLEKGSPLNPGNRAVMVSWKERGGPVQHHYGNIMECRSFWEAYERADYLVAHNAKFECGWMIRCGQDPTDKLWADTMIGEKVRLGNRFALLALEEVSPRYGFKGKEKLIASLMASGVCPSQMPERRLIARARRDVRTTEQIWMKQLKGLQREGKLQVLLTRCLLTPILAQIETNGMVLDKQRVLDTYAEYAEKLEALNRELEEFTGGINMRSPDQKARFLYRTLKFPEPVDKRGRPKRNKPSKQFPEGRPKTDKHTMAWLMTQAKTEKQRKFIELREQWGKLDAAMTKNLQFFRGVVEEREGCKFYGQFNQCNTQTHRLSASGRPQKFEMFSDEKSVQFQNMPRVFKTLFTVRDTDYVMVESDGSQLEFRVAAFLGQDSRAIADIRNPDFDAHVQSASIMNSRDYAELLAEYRAGSKKAKELRRIAKTDTFKPLYGGSQGTPEQEEYYRWFQSNYGELYATQEGWVSDVLATGKLVTPWGLRFYWDFYLSQSGTPMDRKEHKSIKPSIFNYPVQSLATAEIIPIAMFYLHYRCKRAGLRVTLVNTVHDSIVAEVHKEDLTKYTELVKQAFTDDVYRYLRRVYGMEFNVPMGCEVVAGAHWSEGEEVTFNVEPPEWRNAAGVEEERKWPAGR